MDGSKPTHLAVKAAALSVTQGERHGTHERQEQAP